MPVSLRNSKDIVANSVAIVKGNKLIDVLETIDAVQGLAPETLNSLEKLATALNNDSNYFQTVSAAIGNKADASDVYTKTQVNDKFTDIIAGAPDALNTLKELSDALGSDANFSTTVVTELGKKAPKESPTFTGTVTIPTLTFNNADLQTTLNNKAPKENPTLSGTVKVNAIDAIPNADDTIPDLSGIQN